MSLFTSKRSFFNHPVASAMVNTAAPVTKIPIENFKCDENKLLKIGIRYKKKKLILPVQSIRIEIKAVVNRAFPLAKI